MSEAKRRHSRYPAKREIKRNCSGSGSAARAKSPHGRRSHPSDKPCNSLRNRRVPIKACGESGCGAACSPHVWHIARRGVVDELKIVSAPGGGIVKLKPKSRWKLYINLCSACRHDALPSMVNCCRNHIKYLHEHACSVGRVRP